MSQVSVFLVLLTHFLIGFYFVFFGFWNVYHWRPRLETMVKRQVPHALFLLPLGILWQVLAGFFIIFGIFIKLAALSLIPFTLIAILIFNPFWLYEGELRRLHMVVFLTQLMITIGALLLLVNNISPILQFAEILS